MLPWILGCIGSFELVFQSSQGIIPAVELLSQKVVPFLVFWGNSRQFSTVAAPVCIPTNCVLVFHFLHLPVSIWCLLIYDIHSDLCEMVSHCGFNLHLSDGWWCWASFQASFHMSLGPLYVLLEEVSVQVPCPFFNWIACLLGVALCEFFIHFGVQTLVQGIIGKYIFP